MTNQSVLEDLSDKFGPAIFDAQEPYNLLTVSTTRDQIIPILQYLYSHKEFQFTFLTDLCGIHYPKQQDRELGVVYHLHSLINNFRLRIKVFVPVSDPVVPTASGLFPTANWMERETYDFFGIIFSGHPNLTRILNIEEMDYFPLRKEYPLEDPTRQDKVDSMFGR